MSEFNFDKMKNIDIPESFVERALNIPTEKKYPVIFLKYSKTIAFAASFVLVCCLSVALFFITNKNEAAPPVKSSETQYSTNVQINPTDAENSQSEEQPKGDSTDSAETETQPVTEVFETVEPTEENSVDDGESSSNSVPLKPNKHPENTDYVKPKPTQNIEKPTKPKPTQKPTINLEEEPPNDAPPDDTESKSYISKFSDGKITAEIHYSDNSEAVYCRLYDSRGCIVGDRDLYSSKREAVEVDKISTDDSEYSTYEYKIADLGENLNKGTYEVVFYNEIGIFLCNGYITIS